MPEDRNMGGANDSKEPTPKSGAQGFVPRDTGGGGFQPLDLQGLAATIPYYQVAINQINVGGTNYDFGAAQNVTVQMRGNSMDVRALGTTSLWVTYDTPDVSCTITQNMGFGDPCPGLLGQNDIGIVTQQTTLSAGDLPKYVINVTVGAMYAEMPRMSLDGVDVGAAVGNFATLDWRFTGYAIRITNDTAFTQTAWESPDVTTQAVFVKQGNVFANIAGIQHRVQNARFSCNLARDPLKQLGTHEPYASVPTLPVTAEATIEAYPVGQANAQVIEYYTEGLDPAIYARPSATTNATLVMLTPTGDGGYFGANTGHNRCTFTVPNATVQVLGLTGATTAYGTVAYTCRGYDLLYTSDTV